MAGNPLILVVFGRPGSGKTTITELVVEKVVTQGRTSVLHLDLDVCIPQWMKDNFAAGVYPTLAQRLDFAQAACDYVQGRIDSHGSARAVLVSFSFVNTDLRDVFRTRFPFSQWLLIDTSEKEAQRRIEERKGHFYKGKLEKDAEDVVDQHKASSSQDNSEWVFATVTFPHTTLDGLLPPEQNAQTILSLLNEAILCER